ncbi:helix-turn-helix domain-containing protein [Streptomyces sp. NPDC056938]|uniref:helix-turn-helix domain-containing protein n=1 Tax=unclassified Streptomyces TaxID=2593676 RepID=UPI0036446EE5
MRQGCFRSVVVDVHQLAEYRYRAVREVLGGSPIGEVAARYGTSRQTQPTWRLRFEQEGMPGLLDRSRRPRNSPTRLSAEVEADRPSAVPWVSTQGLWELFDEGALSKPWCGAWMFAVGSGLLPAQGPIEARAAVAERAGADGWRAFPCGAGPP